jgi:hypothetical protein
MTQSSLQWHSHTIRWFLSLSRLSKDEDKSTSLRHEACVRREQKGRTGVLGWCIFLLSDWQVPTALPNASWHPDIRSHD